MTPFMEEEETILLWWIWLDTIYGGDGNDIITVGTDWMMLMRPEPNL